VKISFQPALSAIALVGAAVLATAAALRPQDEAAPAAPPGMDPALMEKMASLATPGEPHRDLGKMAGRWEQELRMRMGPDMPWMDVKSASEAKPLLGGRYIMETVRFEMMGMPVEGINILGFDNLKQEYTSMWADTMGTWWVTARGRKDASGKIDMKGTMIDVAGERPFRMVIQSKGDDLVESEMYDTIPPAGEVKVMSIVSKRKK